MTAPFLLQTDASDTNPIGLLLVYLLGCGIYLLPAIIGRKKRNSNSITLLNLFLGWTLIGWVVALVWATSHDPAPPRVVRAPLASPADELAKLQALREAGALNEEEFLQAKLRVLSRS